MTIYREGQDERHDENIQDKPITGFLVLQHASGEVDVVQDLAGFSCQRTATLTDIRNLSLIASKDANNAMLTKNLAGSLLKSLTKVTKGKGGK